MRPKFYSYPVILLLFVLVYSCKKDDTTADPTPDPILSVLNISRTDVEVGNEVGFADTVMIRSNVDWTISLSAGANAWLSVDPIKKATSDSTVVTIKITAANTASSQTATITVTPASSDLQPRQINITRKIYGLLWQKCYGGSRTDQCYGTVLFPNGEFVTNGYSMSTDGDALGNIDDYSWILRVGSDGNTIWSKVMAGYSVGGSYQSVVAATDGGTVSTGYVPTYNRWYDVSVTKFDAAGNMVWNKAYGGSQFDQPYKILNAPDGGYYIAGQTPSQDGDIKIPHGNTDLFVFKIDVNGNLVWEKQFGGNNDELYGTIAACSDGGYILCSSSNSAKSGDVISSHGQDDFFVVKIDANGNKIWAKTYGGSNNDVPRSVIGDADGGCIITGYTNSGDGDLAGHRTSIDFDMWVVKLNKNGQIVWQTTLGGTGVDKGRNVVRLPNGNIVIGGTTDSSDGDVNGKRGSNDIWVVMLNNAGKKLWQKTFGTSYPDENEDLAVASDGSIVFTNTVLTNDGDVTNLHGSFDAWIFKLK